ncbi:hypothetical protein C8Q78DRAFT_1080891 [Trametes maxima]|nr:hypothetical protein C8Q78DRAFT_1080891 [Trametes maxima]
MSVAIVLPDLPTWVQQHITTLYSATTPEQFNQAFDAFVSEHATIRVNGKHLSRAQYKKLLFGEERQGTDTSANVTFNGVVSVPVEDDVNAIGTGSVGVLFKAVLFGRLFVFAARESSTVNSSLNVVVTEDIPRPHLPHGIRGDFDGRRVTVIDEVLTDEPNKIVPPRQPPTSTTTTA